ncbi:AraC family transcriptional regulator [Paenibacillus pinisoli]|uniref:AraC family transcriptional regulator n=1 Tax=Paenibacillus pinisoli TaxID=1276110 RepID=A0A3A6PDY1_9BACL|nr:AraC family transcriptional regulator [Paenibacillus pinisoli]RJX38997.1 AraC family transcriptional regulator [Paenibacillus pinisoli]
MMILYGAEHHLLVLSDAIAAEEHQHSFLQVTLSLEGEFEIDVEGRSLRCSGIVINSNVAHRLEGSGHPLLLLLMDSTSDMAASFKRLIGDRKYEVLPPEQMKGIREYVPREYPNVKDSESYLSFLEQLMKLLGVEHLNTAIADPRIREFIGLVKECTDSEHSVGQYARSLGLSNSRLSHLFKENTGIPLSGYMLLHKLQKATYFIFKGLSITDAAMAAGFDSPSHLAATSKRLLGMTAKDIRKDSVFLQVSCLH